MECSDGLNGVWAASDDEIFAVGLQGECIHLASKSLNVSVDSQKRKFINVHGSSRNNVFAVGDGGVVRRFDGNSWSDLSIGTTNNLMAVLSLSDTETYVAGGSGVLFRWSGNTWEWLGGEEMSIHSLAWYNGKLYAAAGADGVFILGDNGLEKIKDLKMYYVHTIGDSLFAVGNRFVARYDGSGWWGGNLAV